METVEANNNELAQGLTSLATALGAMGLEFDNDARALEMGEHVLRIGARLVEGFEFDAEEFQVWLEAAAAGAVGGVPPTPAPPAEPLWLTTARTQLGVTEVPGFKSNPRIVEYQTATKQHETGDHIPWCAAYICWLFEKHGIESPRDARSRHFLKWGKEVDKPSLGTVTVLWRGRRDDGYTGHVGLWLAEDEDRVLLHGGNQRNRVSEAWYPKARVLGYRMPLTEATPWTPPNS